MRSSLPHTASLLLVLATLACNDATTPDGATRPEARLPLNAAEPDAECPACVFGPRTFTRTNGKPVTESFEIAGDAAADYVIDITDHGSPGANASVLLNGELLAGPEQISGEGEFHLRRAVTMRERSRLEVRLTGKPGSRVAISLLGGVKSIGAEGGTLTAIGRFAELVIDPGVLSQATELTLMAAAIAENTSSGLVDSAVRLALPASAIDPTTTVSGGVEVRVARSRELSGGATPYFHAVVSSTPDSLWARAKLRDDGRLALLLPAHTLQALGALSRASTLFLSLTGMEVLPSAADNETSGLIAGSGAMRSLGAETAVAGDRCTPLPIEAPEGAFAPCGRSILHRVAGNPASAADAIVLVHGWLKSAGDWPGYYAAQGIMCDASNAYRSCWLDPVMAARAGFPGQKYFKRLLPQLINDFPNKAIYVFDYETFRDYSHTGSDLANLLRAEQQRYAFRSIVLVGHSMGGLVSRVAAHALEPSSGTSVPIAGVMALGSPHLGTPLPTDLFANVFFAGVPSPGGQSMTRVLPRTETVPLYVYAGDMSDRWTPDVAFGLSGNMLALRGYLENDGAVPTSHARPTSFSDANVVLRPKYSSYDHSDLINGRSGWDFGRDVLYRDIRTDLRALIAAGPPPPKTAFAEDFSSILANWRLVTGGSWTIQNGRLVGEYDIGCGSYGCSQSDLLLTDALQPGNADWRAEVEFTQVAYPYSSSYNMTYAQAFFSLYVSSTEKMYVRYGWDTRNTPMPAQLTQLYVDARYFPWGNLVHSGTMTVAPWRPLEWNTAALEKRGDTYTMFFNGEAISTFQATFSQPPKVGLHVYGKSVLDNFKLTRL